MANLTGEYDVATEVGVGLVNCILAAIHENENEAYPRLPHSFKVRVDDTYRGAGDPVPEAERTGLRTTAEVQLSTPTVSLPAAGLADPVWSPSRVSVRTAIGLGRPPKGPFHPGRGATCWPTINVAVGLRAWLRDRPEELPEFLHGELHLSAGIVRTDLPRRGTFLGLDHSSGLAVRFDPAAGTTVSDGQRALVERIVRNFIRADSEPVSFKVALPAEVRRFDYKLQPSAPRPSVMLMFVLGDRSPQSPGGLSASFLPSGADFAVGIGRDYLLALLREGLLRGLPAEYSASGTGYKVRIRPDWDGAVFDLEPGRIRLSVSGSGSITYGFGPFSTTDDWSFTVRQAISLGVVEGSLKPAIAGDPEVDLHDVAVFEGTIREKARERIRAELERTLDAAPPELRDALDVGNQMEELIATLHPSPPGVALAGVEIRPEGIVVGGTVALAPSRPVQVKRSDLNGYADALESWIPGGTIARFVWEDRVEEHRFVTDKPRFASAALRCLSVEGTRVTRGGGVAPVSADDCPVIVVNLPVFSGPPAPPLPCRRPLLPLLGGTPEGRVEVVGHYDPWASGLVPTGGPTNLLVHFATGAWAPAARALDEAFAATAERDAALVVLGVLEEGELGKAANATLDADATLLLTDDPSGRWGEAFGISQAPATVLVGPTGEIRWKDEAPLDPAKLAEVLKKQLETGGELSWRVLRPAVTHGERAPDVPFAFGDGRELALRRLGGQPVVLSFWTSCSEPSLEQLRQLDQALECRSHDGPLVIGIGDGESPQQVAELAACEELHFPLVADPERLISRRYGVSCWPVTVQVSSGGTIEASDLGLVPGLNPCGGPVYWPPLIAKGRSEKIDFGNQPQ